MERAGRSQVLRAEGAEAHRVTFFELFFDLVYVLAITQLSHTLIEDLTLRGAARTLVLLLAVWWAWVYTAWATNWLDPDSRPVRLMLVAVMGAGLVMTAALPEAYSDRGLAFAAAYSLLQVGRSAFVLWAFRHHPRQWGNFQRILSWNVAASLVWIAGGFADESARELIWLVAIVVDYAAPAAGFWVPGLGRSLTSEWTVTGSHFAERFKLFVILALGESILITGMTFSGLEISTSIAMAFGVAFVGSVALWWIYFDRTAEAGTGVLEGSEDPGRLARSAYTYFHLPIVAGIIVVAVADELVIGHPDGQAEIETVVVSVVGPALFLAGHALYKWASFGVISLPRVLAVAALGALGFIGTALTPLLLATVATLVVIAVAVWDAIQAPHLDRAERANERMEGVRPD